jgi:cytochrome d ubiquinol oxidase subunit II
MTTFWFIIDVVFWTGFFVLEGFDFGVGALHSVVGRDERQQRVAVNTIGPFWDGNEVWLIVAGAVIFAAFPQWYATMFSSFYLALLLVLVALMARGVAFEYRAKVADERWTAGWRWSLTIGSIAIPLLIGVALGDLLHGLPINQSHVYTGTFWDLLQPYGLWTGITLVALTFLSGSTFLAVKTTGPVRDRAAALAPRVGVVATALVIGFAVWTQLLATDRVVPSAMTVLVVLAAAGATWAASQRAEGWAFAAACIAIGSAVALLFVNLYPHVMVSTTNPAYSLTVTGTASGGYTLRVMTVAAVVATPFVLAYQGWNFWIFRRRLSSGPSEASSTTVAAPGPRGDGARAD